MCPHKNYIDLYVIKKYINQQNSRYTNHYTHKRNYHLKQISYKSVSTPYNLIAWKTYIYIYIYILVYNANIVYTVI